MRYVAVAVFSAVVLSFVSSSSARAEEILSHALIEPGPVISIPVEDLGRVAFDPGAFQISAPSPEDPVSYDDFRRAAAAPSGNATFNLQRFGRLSLREEENHFGWEFGDLSVLPGAPGSMIGTGTYLREEHEDLEIDASALWGAPSDDLMKDTFRRSRWRLHLGGRYRDKADFEVHTTQSRQETPVWGLRGGVRLLERPGFRNRFFYSYEGTAGQVSLFSVPEGSSAFDAFSFGNRFEAGEKLSGSYVFTGRKQLIGGTEEKRRHYKHAVKLAVQPFPQRPRTAFETEFSKQESFFDAGRYRTSAKNVSLRARTGEDDWSAWAGYRMDRRSFSWTAGTKTLALDFGVKANWTFAEWKLSPGLVVGTESDPGRFLEAGRLHFRAKCELNRDAAAVSLAFVRKEFGNSLETGWNELSIEGRHRLMEKDACDISFTFRATDSFGNLQAKPEAEASLSVRMMF